MKIDLIFVNENTPMGSVSVISCKTKKIAKEKFNKLNTETIIDYAYLRKFSSWHHHIVEWYKEKKDFG
jgi:hypothetical protein